MTTDKALEFLRQNQPLPPDTELSGELINRFDEVRRHFLAAPDPRAIPLFLNSFGEGDGLGVYQLVEDVLLQSPSEVVVEHLAKALSSPHASVRYWASQIAASIKSPILVEPLFLLLSDKNPDTRYAAITALEVQAPANLLAILRSAFDTERDPAVRQLYAEVLEDD